MVKSRRAASSSHLAEKATVAWRPSVETSRRKVVISTGPPSVSAATVPWARPVGTLRHAARSQARDHLGRLERGRHVDVLHGQAHQGIAHRAADITHEAFVRRIKRGDQCGQIGALRPVCGG